MALALHDLSDLLCLLRKQGVVSFKDDRVELVLAPAFPEQPETPEHERPAPQLRNRPPTAALRDVPESDLVYLGLDE